MTASPGSFAFSATEFLGQNGVGVVVGISVVLGLISPGAAAV
jgi:hypothetical protein